MIWILKYNLPALNSKYAGDCLNVPHSGNFVECSSGSRILRSQFFFQVCFKRRELKVLKINMRMIFKSGYGTDLNWKVWSMELGS